MQPGPDCLVLVVTDAMGEAWRDGNAAAFLYSSARASPTAVLSLLPQELWEFTLPSAVRARLSVPHTAAPNRRLRLLRTGTSASGLSAPPLSRSGQAVPVPVLELTPGSLGRWASLIASPGGQHSAAVLLTGRRGDCGRHSSLHWPSDPPISQIESRTSSSRSPAGKAVARFIAKSSPTAFTLARRLAAAPLNLPVMRLIQHSQPGAQSWNLAEIMLFGLLRRTNHGASSDVEDVRQVSFDFAEGVREELLSLGTRAETVGVLRQVAQHLGPRLAAVTPEGEALVAWQADAADPPVTDRTLPFVSPLQSALSALSGPFAERARRLGQEILALPDTSTEQDATVRDHMNTIDGAEVVIAPPPQQTSHTMLQQEKQQPSLTGAAMSNMTPPPPTSIAPALRHRGSGATCRNATAISPAGKNSSRSSVGDWPAG